MAAAMSAEDLGGARIASHAADRLRSKHRDLAVETVVRRGDPKRGLVQEAADWDGGADLLVVGAKGARGIERFVLGSVSTWVAMHAACSVEVVHRTPAG
jgi:nucleotide-binding universal stress UspA family protein